MCADTEDIAWYGILVNLSKSELILVLADLSTTMLKTIQNDLFIQTKRKGLCADSGEREGHCLQSKLSDDIWTILDGLRDNVSDPRSVL